MHAIPRSNFSTLFSKVVIKIIAQQIILSKAIINTKSKIANKHNEKF